MPFAAVLATAGALRLAGSAAAQDDGPSARTGFPVALLVLAVVAVALVERGKRRSHR